MRERGKSAEMRVTLKTALASLGLVVALPAGRTAHPAPPGWEQIALPRLATCAFDTPFSFFVHRPPTASPARLLIYFEGGGACWDWVSCSGTFDPSVADGELDAYRGIFDFSNPANPFRDDAVVFIPYCTGDVHVGDTIRRYGRDSTSRPVHHQGSRNVQAVLDWIARQNLQPPQVVVAGTSAGSYGALFYLPAVARLFPGEPLVLIGDSGVPLLPDYPARLAGWGAGAALGRIRGGSARATADALRLEYAWRLAAEAVLPHGRLALLTSDQDAIQSAFYIISGSTNWRKDTYRLLDTLETSPFFHDFVVGGSDHGLLVTDRFYRYTAGGVRLSDWIARLLAGTAVGNEHCRACRPD